ncbi:MAG: response regulator [Acidobacteria bacterium]|nr:response regulator [Acidobacteriota bacterium]
MRGDEQLKPTVLIVDDEEDVVKPLAFRMSVQGFDVLLEPDGELGYQTAMERRPDIILLDIMMPGIDGITLCKILKEKEETRHIPILMLTAKTLIGDVERAFAADADDYIAKPFEWDELFGKVHRALARRAAAPA